ncbi:TonB family protein [uncultured Winogradskyella sp.]|uniref:TonB family protein n=1 Tax=uncultured Winogradskyella sp. TaxID=395353 RepID=UPI0026355695|nr:TonB family protein [uncultured Winogradskyella sp.]
MKFIEQHKAAIITFLLASTLVLALFSIHLKQQGDLITESYYELEPEPEKSPEETLQDTETLTGATSDKVFNEDQDYKDMLRNFKTISANDFERTTKSIEASKTSDLSEDYSINKSYTNTNAYALNANESESYKKLKEQLNKRLENKKIADQHAKTKSTLTYSLKGRIMEAYDIPRYLCENGGKIVVSITVNSKGKVTDASINNSSNSKNVCLINRALEYAKAVQFNPSSKTSQIGTITFIFRGKR